MLTNPYPWLASALLLIPGALTSRALRLRGFAPALAWSLAALIGALALTFALHRSLWLALGVLAAVSVAALPFSFRDRPAWDLDHVFPVEAAVLAAGIAFGIALWHVAVLDGDAFFHVARVRKLEVFGTLSLHDIGEFRDASLHPGYYIVFSGIYGSAATATSALARARAQGFPDAYTARVTH